MKSVLFDLDGTITDSGPGITACAQYALHHFGIEEPVLSNLNFFVGPPLVDTFMGHYGFSKENALEAVEKYRERYHKTGMFECTVYPGVEETLQYLKQKNVPVMLASSKPEESCKKILEHFGLLSYFDEIVGAEMHGPRNAKSDVLLEVLRRKKIEAKDCVLIGDTKFDAIGAATVGMECIGVSYGYGTKEELQEAGAVAVCKNMKEVEQYLEEHYLAQNI